MFLKHLKSFAVKVDRVTSNKESVYTEVLIFTNSLFDITSVNFHREKVYENEIFGRQDTLQFFLGESKNYNCLKTFGGLGEL